jgi:hypothetical protein
LTVKNGGKVGANKKKPGLEVITFKLFIEMMELIGIELKTS